MNILYLAPVSLMPFSSALSGQYSPILFSQIFYSGNMMLLAAAALLVSRHISRHPELCSVPVTPGIYRASRFRIAGP